jgi:hypothetical protein
VGLDVSLVGKTPTLSGAEGEIELIAPRFLNRHRVNPNHEHIDLVYFAVSTTKEINPTDGREKSPAIKWFTKEELLDPNLEIWQRVRHYALTALDEVNG